MKMQILKILRDNRQECQNAVRDAKKNLEMAKEGGNKDQIAVAESTLHVRETSLLEANRMFSFANRQLK